MTHRLRTTSPLRAALLGVLFTVLCVVSTNAQTPLDSLGCRNDSAMHRLEFPGVLFTGSITDTIDFRNVMPNIHDTVFVYQSKGTNGDTSFKLISATDSLHINQGFKGKFAFQYQPIDTSEHSDTLIFRSIGPDSCVDSFYVHADGIHLTPNRTSYSLASPTNPPIAFASSQTDSTLVVFFRNDSPSPILISTIFLTGQSDTNLKIVAAPPFNDSVHPHDSVQVSFRLHRTSQGFSHALLVIGMPDEPILQEFISVQGLRLPDAAVETPSEALGSFSLYPNPSRGPVTVRSDGLTHTQVRVLDLLGRTLREAHFAGEWAWDGLSASGDMLSDGTYFIVAEGVAANGQQVRKVMPLLLQR